MNASPYTTFRLFAIEAPRVESILPERYGKENTRDGGRNDVNECAEIRWLPQPSPTIAQCLNGGYGFLEVKCHRCETKASIPLPAITRPQNTPIWKLEASLKCRSCRKGKYAPPVHMIRLTEDREITTIGGFIPTRNGEPSSCMVLPRPMG